MGGHLIGLNQNGWPFSITASEHSALTAAALSELGPSLLAGSVNSCQGCSLMESHTHKNMYERRCLPAHSGCCCPSGLCSGLAGGSSLCLCCRWCVSSLGYPSFCWRGTSPLFQLPGELDSSDWKQTSHVQRILSISVSLSHNAENTHTCSGLGCYEIT